MVFILYSAFIPWSMSGIHRFYFLRLSLVFADHSVYSIHQSLASVDRFVYIHLYLASVDHFGYCSSISGVRRLFCLHSSICGDHRDHRPFCLCFVYFLFRRPSYLFQPSISGVRRPFCLFHPSISGVRRPVFLDIVNKLIRRGKYSLATQKFLCLHM